MHGTSLEIADDAEIVRVKHMRLGVALVQFYGTLEIHLRHIPIELLPRCSYSAAEVALGQKRVEFERAVYQ